MQRARALDRGGGGHGAECAHGLPGWPELGHGQRTQEARSAPSGRLSRDDELRVVVRRLPRGSRVALKLDAVTDVERDREGIGSAPRRAIYHGHRHVHLLPNVRRRARRFRTASTFSATTGTSIGSEMRADTMSAHQGARLETHHPGIEVLVLPFRVEYLSHRRHFERVGHKANLVVAEHLPVGHHRLPLVVLPSRGSRQVLATRPPWH